MLATIPETTGTAIHEPAQSFDRTRREFTAVVVRIRFFDESTGAIIAGVRPPSTEPRPPLPAGVELHSIKGECGDGELEEGTAYTFHGRWTNHPKYGPQFNFDTFTQARPSSRVGVLRYLAREIAHIGKVTAQKLWDAYSDETLDVLRCDPARVASDGILSPNEAEAVSRQLAAQYQDEKTKVELFTLFAGRGFPASTIKSCIQKWGVNAADRVRRNPYTLLVNDVPGAGWIRCDKLFLDLGGRKDRLKRQMLCAWSALRDTDGDTWMIEGAARRAIVSATGVRLARIDAAIQLGIRSRWLAERRDSMGERWIAERFKADNEQRLAQNIRRLMAGTKGEGAPHLLWPSLDEITSGPGAALSEHQRAGLASILTSPVAILAGTPGTGKTFTAAALLRAVVNQHGKTAIAVCAPTGKAAVRITEAMQRYQLPLEASTIHRLLEIGRNGHDGKGWGFLRNEINPLRQKFVVIDETSMIDTTLAADLFAACADGTHVLMVGDPGQLPPVGHGAPLRDLITNNCPPRDNPPPHTVLTEIKRNAGLIVKACSAIKDGRPFKTCDRFDLSPEVGDNLRLIQCEPETQDEVTLKILSGIRAGHQHDPMWDVQVLVARNDERHRLNKLLQGLLNPPVAGGPVATDQAGNVTAKASKFRVGDKIICLRNSVAAIHALSCDDDEVCDKTRVESYSEVSDVAGPIMAYLANGDMGRVEAVGHGQLIARFLHPTRLVKILIGKQKDGDGGADNKAGGESASSESSDFDLAYAITTHKSQGSEWPIVIVLIDEGGQHVASREWWYTAVSRAAKACLLVGRMPTMLKQIKKVNLKKRKTFLVEELGAWK